MGRPNHRLGRRGINHRQRNNTTLNDAQHAPKGDFGKAKVRAAGPSQDDGFGDDEEALRGLKKWTSYKGMIASKTTANICL